MKKLMSLLLAGLFVLAAAGCSKPVEPPADAPADTGDTTEEVQEEGS